MSFDDMGGALVALLQAITFDDYDTTMHALQTSVSPAAFFYFVLAIVICGFFIINLFLAVMFDEVSSKLAAASQQQASSKPASFAAASFAAASQQALPQQALPQQSGTLSAPHCVLTSPLTPHALLSQCTHILSSTPPTPHVTHTSLAVHEGKGGGRVHRGCPQLRSCARLTTRTAQAVNGDYRRGRLLASKRHAAIGWELGRRGRRRRRRRR